MDAPDERSRAVGGGDEEGVGRPADVGGEEALVGAGQPVEQAPDAPGLGGDVEALENAQASPRTPSLEEGAEEGRPGTVVGLRRRATVQGQRDGDGHGMPRRRGLEEPA
jgi:hypothetical protein